MNSGGIIIFSNFLDGSSKVKHLSKFCDAIDAINMVIIDTIVKQPIILFIFIFLVRSFINLVPDHLRQERISYILSDRFNQDPLEEHFGKQRSRGVENPTLEQYMYNERKILVSKSDMIIKGNTRGKRRTNAGVDVNDDRVLPKRNKTKKTL